MINKEYKVFNKDQDEANQKLISDAIINFNQLEGGFGKRNFIKQVLINGVELNIKSFKVPNLINRIAYSLIRKSKARRSFEYATKLLKLGINSPKPIAFFEYSNLFFLRKSFYVSKQFPSDMTYRELIYDHNHPDFEVILRGFTRFTFSLHENSINFLDHSPGNTLIKKNKNTGEYDFYLIDLNRMKFHEMNFKDRMKNFAKLSPKDIMLDIMCDEYAKLYTLKTKEEIVETMYFYSRKFSTGYKKKEKFKKRYFFWRKK